MKDLLNRNALLYEIIHNTKKRETGKAALFNITQLIFAQRLSRFRKENVEIIDLEDISNVSSEFLGKRSPPASLSLTSRSSGIDEEDSMEIDGAQNTVIKIEDDDEVSDKQSACSSIFSLHKFNLEEYRKNLDVLRTMAECPKKQSKSRRKSPTLVQSTFEIEIAKLNLRSFEYMEYSKALLKVEEGHEPQNLATP